jgi:hypothetical protein
LRSELLATEAQATGEFDTTMRRSDGDHVRVTNRTLPPTQEFPEAGASTGVFLGDYMGLAVGSDGVALPGLDRHPQPDLPPAPAATSGSFVPFQRCLGPSGSPLWPTRRGSASTLPPDRQYLQDYAT